MVPERPDRWPSSIGLSESPAQWAAFVDDSASLTEGATWDRPTVSLSQFEAPSAPLPEDMLQRSDPAELAVGAPSDASDASVWIMEPPDARDECPPAQLPFTDGQVRWTAFAEPAGDSDPEPPQTVAMHLDDVDVRKALEMLSREGSVNMLVSPGVTGRVTADLQGLDFEEALTAILRLCDLVALREGRMIFVYSAQEVPQRELSLRTYPLDYVAATDVLAGVQALLSPVGKAFVTESSDTDNRRTHEVIVAEDLPERLDRIRQYLFELDRPPRQVLIEAHVLAVELEDDAKHGINWEYLDLNNPSLTLRTQGFADGGKFLNGSLFPFGAGAEPAFFFNLAATNLNVLIEALETSTDAKTLARPKVLALNGQKARIQIGERLGYRVTTVTETAATETTNFLEVGVVLEVTPWITDDGGVLMQVKPKVSDGKINQVTKLPDEETTEVETSLMLPDGHGMVIGGLIQEKDEETQHKIPIVGDLWLVGRLFQSRTIERDRQEFIIALVPHVLPYQSGRHWAECEQFDRATTPLTYGPLRQNPRPWEPRFPDAGQHLPLRYKAEKFHPLPDRGPWCPQGSQERCIPGLQPSDPGDLGH